MLGTRLRGAQHGGEWKKCNLGRFSNYFRIFSPKNRKKKVALRIHSFVIVEGSVGVGTKFSLLRVSKVEKSADRNVCLLHFGCTPLSILPCIFFLLESGLHYVTSGQCHLDANKTFCLKTCYILARKKIFFVIGMTLLAIFNAYCRHSKVGNTIEFNIICIYLRRKRKAELFPSLLSVREYRVRDGDGRIYFAHSQKAKITGRSRPSRTAVISKVFSWTHHAALSYNSYLLIQHMFVLQTKK